MEEIRVMRSQQNSSIVISGNAVKFEQENCFESSYLLNTRMPTAKGGPLYPNLSQNDWAETKIKTNSFLFSPQSNYTD
jgi:hypothetical protein